MSAHERLSRELAMTFTIIAQMRSGEHVTVTVYQEHSARHLYEALCAYAAAQGLPKPEGFKQDETPWPTDEEENK